MESNDYKLRGTETEKPIIYGIKIDEEHYTINKPRRVITRCKIYNKVK